MEANKVELTPFIISTMVLLGIEAASEVLAAACSTRGLLHLGATRLLEIIMLIQVIRIWGGGLSAIGVTFRELPSGMKRGVIWSVAFGAFAAAGLGILKLFGLSLSSIFRVPMPDNGVSVLLFLIIGGIIAPVGEEIFFRGIVYGFLRHWGRTVALVLSTILFVFAHSISIRVPVTQAIGGIVFALSYELEGKLIVPVTMHILGNLAIFTVALSIR